MCKKLCSVVVLTAAAALLAGCGPNGQMSIQERRSTINDMAQNTLDDFYATRPALRQEVQAAPGYGVFSNANVSVIFATGGGGYGVVVNNATGERTYMRSGVGGLGLGIGAKDYSELMIFNSPDALYSFTTGNWEWGGQATATAKAGEIGAGLEVAENVGQAIDVYTLTESGLSAELMATGTRYWPVDDLNRPVSPNGEYQQDGEFRQEQQFQQDTEFQRQQDMQNQQFQQQQQEFQQQQQQLQQRRQELEQQRQEYQQQIQQRQSLQQQQQQLQQREQQLQQQLQELERQKQQLQQREQQFQQQNQPDQPVM